MSPIVRSVSLTMIALTLGFTLGNQPTLAAALVGDESSRPVARVFVLAGQSNMQGQGVVDLDHEEYYNGGKGILINVMRHPDRAWQYGHIQDANGHWVVRDDVFVRYRTEHGLKVGGLSIGFSGYEGRHHIGPEFQFGHVVGDAFEEPVLLIKTAWGGKSLFKDFRPPSADGETGPYYTRMMAEIDEALQNVAREIPELAGHELRIEGFAWQQGWNDMFDETALAEYEQNLVHLIHDVRAHFRNDKLPFVIGELGNGGDKAGENMKTIRAAERAVTQRREFRGNTAFVPTTEYARAADQSPNVRHGHHWFGNAESYFLIGDGLGRAMLELLGHGHRVERDIAYKQNGSDYEQERCRLDLYIPETAAEAPVLVWFHGGGLTAGSKDRDEAVLVGRFLADRGYLVAVANYRLSPNVTWPAYVDDAAASVAWALDHAEQYGGDAERVFVGGHSAGAYLTMLVALDDTHLKAHGHHPGELSGSLPVSAQVDSHWTVRREKGIGRDTRVIDESAPLHHVRKDTPPMLVVVAENDLPGRAGMNKQFVSAMQDAGHIGTEFHRIPDRGHSSLITQMPSPDDATAGVILEFLKRYSRR